MKHSAFYTPNREDGFKERNETSFTIYTDEKQEKLALKTENCYKKVIQDVVGYIKNETPTRLSLQNGIDSPPSCIKVKRETRIIVGVE